MDIKSGFAFNDTTAVITYGIGCNVTLLKISGTEIVIKSNQYLKDPVGGYEIKYDDYFQVVKLSDTKGLIMGYYSGGDEVVYACAFKLNDDNESLTFGTVYKGPNYICNNSNHSSLLAINSKNAVFTSLREYSSGYRYLYHTPVIINDNLEITLGTIYNVSVLNQNSYMFRKLANSTASYFMPTTYSFGVEVYEYDIATATIVAKGTLYPENKPEDLAGLTSFGGMPISIKDNKMLAFSYEFIDDDVALIDHHCELTPYIAEFK